MSSVVQRISQIKQPKNGYIPSWLFQEEHKLNLNPMEPMQAEGIHPSTVGLAVDYLSRLVLTNDICDAFKISIMGLGIADKCMLAGYCRIPDPKETAIRLSNLLNENKPISKKSITAACELVLYDDFVRDLPTALEMATAYRIATSKILSPAAIINISEMVHRSEEFFSLYGPVTMNGFTLAGAYTNVIDSGDGDFLTKDTLWDFKVSKYPPQFEEKYTLQLLVYYLMGLHSIHPEFEDIKNLGFFNPRRGDVSIIPISVIPKETMEEVNTKIIGYKE